MAETITLEKAADALGRHFGERLVAGRDEGRRLLAEALQEELGVSMRQAKQLVRDLENARSIPWVEREVEQDENAPGPALMMPDMVARQTGRGVAKTPGQGYWQL